MSRDNACSLISNCRVGYYYLVPVQRAPLSPKEYFHQVLNTVSGKAQVRIEKWVIAPVLSLNLLVGHDIVLLLEMQESSHIHSCKTAVKRTCIQQADNTSSFGE
jgi:hypothetical protein